MVEEKARSLLPRHHFASLSYYIAEYSAKAMTIDAFVAVLLEMLDTYEKVSHLENCFPIFLEEIIDHISIAAHASDGNSRTRFSRGSYKIR